ncbi:MAG: hypothetical protein WD013_02380 [Gemmatimonadota bacterium]
MRASKGTGLALGRSLLVLVLLGVLIGGVYQVLLTNQRIQSHRAGEVDGPTSLQAGIEVLAQELREASPSGGDLTRIGRREVAFRASRAFGITCGIVSREPLTLAVVPEGRRFAVGDQLFVFSAGHGMAMNDDAWVPWRVEAVEEAGSCGESDTEAQVLVMDGDSRSHAGAGIGRGSFVRAWEPVRYFVETLDGEPHVILDRAGERTRLIGPLADDEGFELNYFDELGRATADPSVVRTAEVTLRALGQADGSRRVRAVDSLSTLIFLRN